MRQKVENMETLPRLLWSKEEAATISCLSLRSINYYIGKKQLGTIRKGRRVLIHHKELSRFCSMSNFDGISEAPDNVKWKCLVNFRPALGDAP